MKTREEIDEMAKAEYVIEEGMSSFSKTFKSGQQNGFIEGYTHYIGLSELVHISHAECYVNNPITLTRAFQSHIEWYMPLSNPPQEK